MSSSDDSDTDDQCPRPHWDNLDRDGHVDDHDGYEADAKKAARVEKVLHGDSQTYFDPNEADKGIWREDNPRLSYETLLRRNHGPEGPEREKQNREAGREQDVLLACDILEVRDTAKQRAKDMFEAMDIQGVHRHADAEEYALAIVALAVNVGPKRLRRHVQQEDQWSDLCESWDADKRMVKWVRRKILESDWWNQYYTPQE